MAHLTENTHADATNLRGFASSTLRVFVTRIEGDYVWVRTADLLDAGTPLTLDASQVAPEQPVTVERHASGLVVFA
jgi:hypothetical protein